MSFRSDFPPDGCEIAGSAHKRPRFRFVPHSRFPPVAVKESVLRIERTTPVKMSREAARAVPRYALLGLLAVFIGNAFGVQDFWTLSDAENFGVAAEMLRGGTFADFLLPTLTGLPHWQSGPLTAWVSAFFLALLGPVIGDMSALRCASLFWYALALSTLWYGTWHIARRPEAQPLRFPFGDEANPKDYGRVTADVAALLFVATFGLVRGFHEPTPATALLALSCLSFYGHTKALKRPVIGFALAGMTAGLAVLTSTLFGGVWLLASSIAVNATVRAFPGSPDLRYAALLGSAALTVALWPALGYAVDPEAARLWFAGWADAQADLFGIASLDTLTWFVRNFVWFLCPLWPLVFAGLYNWRHGLTGTHLAIPLVTISISVFAVLFSSSQAAESVFIVFLPTLAVLASFGLFTLKKGRANTLDWFAVSIFTLIALTLWAYFLAWSTNFAPKMANSITRLAPEALPSVSIGFWLGLLMTVLWGTFVVWRLTHRPVVVWRGAWLAAFGLTTCIVLMMGLFHDVIDQNRSYRPVVAELAHTLRADGIRPDDCVSLRDIPPGIRAIFAYASDLRYTAKSDAVCRYRVHRERSDLALPSDAVGLAAQRGAYTSERFYVTRNRQNDP